MNIKDLFKKKKQVNNQQEYITVKYSKMDHLGHPIRIPIIQQQTIENLQNSLNEVNNKINQNSTSINQNSTNINQLILDLQNANLANFKGDYSNNQTYKLGDLVVYNQQVYLSIKNNNNQQPTNNNYWRIITFTIDTSKYVTFDKTNTFTQAQLLTTVGSDNNSIVNKNFVNNSTICGTADFSYGLKLFIGETKQVGSFYLAKITGTDWYNSHLNNFIITRRAQANTKYWVNIYLLGLKNNRDTSYKINNFNPVLFSTLFLTSDSSGNLSFSDSTAEKMIHKNEGGVWLQALLIEDPRLQYDKYYIADLYFECIAAQGK